MCVKGWKQKNGVVDNCDVCTSNFKAELHSMYGAYVKIKKFTKIE